MRRKKGKEDSSKDALRPADGSSTSSELSPQRRGPIHYFQCQFAHGGPTGRISGFRSIKELYIKIAECYEILPDDILFCTLNTHKLDMNCLLGSQLCYEDFIFAHIKGQKKEIEIIKSEESLGLTITDNGVGKAFIKKIRESSQISKLGQGLIDVGDHIEKVDNEYYVGKRHYDIAAKLRSICVGTKFILRLISPQKSIYGNINKRPVKTGTNKLSIVEGKTTLRMSGGTFLEVENNSKYDSLAIEAISRLVEKVLGISDNEMAQSILEIGKKTRNPAEFNDAMRAEMGEFNFPNDLIYDFWGVITDANSGFLTSANDYSTSTKTTAVYYEDRL